MKLVIRQATIIDPDSPHHRSTQDIFIDNGIITQVGQALNVSADKEINMTGMFISPGWIDIFSNFCDPGYEFKETLESGSQAAAAGGYTTVFTLPNTKPVVDNKSQVEYIVQRSRSLPVEVIPIGAITRQAEGKELAEMYDMQHSGAIAFSDGLNPVQSSGILVKALQYIKQFNGVLIQVPDDKNLVPHGLMNEGIVSTRLGLSGKPVLAEELMIDRDLKLAAYTQSRIHFTGVTSFHAIESIRRAKEQGQAVTCSVAPYHLFFCDEDLMEYDANLKVNPPLRTRAEMMLLRQAVRDGIVDCIASHHAPQDFDSKVVEFEYAKFGMIGLETAYAVVKTVFPELDETKLYALFAGNAAKIFGLSRPSIAENNEANCTLYLPGSADIFVHNHIRSKSKNTAFTGKLLQGQVVGVVRGSELVLN